MRCNIFSEKCTFVLRAKNDAKTPHFQRLQALSPTRVPVFQDSPPTIVGKKVSLPQKQGQRHLAPRQVTHPPPKDTRRARACTPPPVPVPRRPCSRFVSRVLYTPVELEELRNISCKSILRNTISSAIILFVANWAALYAGASVCGSGICSASEPPAYPLTNYHIHHIQQTC